MPTKNCKIVKHLLSLGVIGFVVFLSSCEKKECPDNEPTGYPPIVYDACVDFADEDISLMAPCSQVIDTSITYYPKDFYSSTIRNSQCSGKYQVFTYLSRLFIENTCENFETTGRVEVFWKTTDSLQIFDIVNFLNFQYYNDSSRTLGTGSGIFYWPLEPTWPDSTPQRTNNPLVYELTTNCKPQNVASKNRNRINDEISIWLRSDHYTCNHEENVKLIEKYFSHFVVHFRYANP